MAGRFELQPKESALHGMSMRDGTLRIGAPGFRRLASVLWGLAAMVVAGLAVCVAIGAIDSVGGVTIDHPAPAVIALVALAGGLLALASEVGRAVVVASPKGLDVRGRGRRRTLTWAEVADVQAVDTMRGRGDRPNEQTIGQLMSRRTAHSVGAVILRDGTVFELPNCTSMARSEGWAALNTPAEVKVAALRRYREHVDGAHPPRGPISYAQVPRGRPLVAELAVVLLGPPAVWAVLSLSSDDEVDLGAFVAPWVVLVVATVWAQRDRVIHLLRSAAARDGDRSPTSSR